jgi:hypothetical protein
VQGAWSNALYSTLYALHCTLPLSSAGRPGFLGNVNEDLVMNMEMICMYCTTSSLDMNVCMV